MIANLHIFTLESDSWLLITVRPCQTSLTGLPRSPDPAAAAELTIDVEGDGGKRYQLHPQWKYFTLQQL